MQKQKLLVLPGPFSLKETSMLFDFLESILPRRSPHVLIEISNAPEMAGYDKGDAAESGLTKEGFMCVVCGVIIGLKNGKKVPLSKIQIQPEKRAVAQCSE